MEMSELPEGWVECNIGEILVSKKGKKPESTTSEYHKGYYPYILIDELEGKTIRAYTNDSSVPMVNKDDVLLVWDGSIGKCGSGIQGVIGSTLVGLTPLGGIPPKFLEYTIRYVNNFIKETSTGTGLQHINKDFFNICKILVPPLNEQKRIEEKLDRLLNKAQEAKERLQKIPVILKRFRLSILNAAVTGELTKDWRERNKVDYTWEEVTFDKLVPKGGIFDGPFGSNLKTSDYVSKGVRVIRLENLGHLKFISDKYSFINEAKYQSLKKHTVYENDILFSSFIGDEIRACLLPMLKDTAIAKADCFCIRPFENKVIKKYLLLQLVSGHSFSQLINNIHGATRPRINLTQLKQLLLWICSIEEQKEIVKRVEALFKTADEIETRYKKAKAYVDKLTQSILAKAFRGELVPQDPNDESAEKLLERIKAEKEKLSPVKGKRVNKERVNP